MAPLIGKFVKAVAFAVSAPSSSTTHEQQPQREHRRQQQQQQQQRQQLELELDRLEQQLGGSSSPSSSSLSSSSSSRGGGGGRADLPTMCRLFGVGGPHAGDLYLRGGCGGGGGGTGRRGLRVGGDGAAVVKRGEIVMSVPLSSCLRDDEPPAWYRRGGGGGGGAPAEGADDGDVDADGDPTAWSTRLAARVLDVIDPPQGAGGGCDDDDDLPPPLPGGWGAWRSALPDADELRSSLPVHWDERAAEAARCASLELAIDEQYFARENAVSRLVAARRMMGGGGARGRMGGGGDDGADDDRREDDAGPSAGLEALRRKCHDALDIAQTRACRVERKCEDGVQWGPPLRVVAPVFDFINHGGRAGANAIFGVEGERMFDLRGARLVVRATREIKRGEEVLIDYGGSARPQWRCLASYGFVPSGEAEAEAGDDGGNAVIVDNDAREGDRHDDDDDDDVVFEDGDVAELWMNGRRFEVGALSVPFELVEVAAAQALLDDDASIIDEYDFSDDDDDGYEEEEEVEVEVEGGTGEGGGAAALAPSVARAITKRATETAFNLILEPETAGPEEDWDAPEFVRAMSLAASLRWSQHRVLLAFAENLMAFSSSSSSPPSPSTMTED